MDFCLVLTTVADEEQARALARQAVSARLAACVHWEPIRSVYHWNGALQEDTEVRLLFKTRSEHYVALEALLQAQHPYELPAIVALPLCAASAPFARWLHDNTESAPL